MIDGLELTFWRNVQLSQCLYTIHVSNDGNLNWILSWIRLKKPLIFNNVGLFVYRVVTPERIEQFWLSLFCTIVLYKVNYMWVFIEKFNKKRSSVLKVMVGERFYCRVFSLSFTLLVSRLHKLQICDYWHGYTHISNVSLIDSHINKENYFNT